MNCELRIVDCELPGSERRCELRLWPWQRSSRRAHTASFNSKSRIRNSQRLALAALLLAGCGYSSQRPFREGVKTVHVEMLESREFRRELEFNLTEAICKRIEMDTPYKIAPLRTADTLFTGEVLEVQERVFGDDFRTGRPREKGATVVIRYHWKDLRTGRTLVERERFAFMTNYYPSLGESFTKGMVRGLDGMAEAIVETMESEW